MQLNVTTQYHGEALPVFSFDCYVFDNHDELASAINDRLGNPPGRYELFFKLQGKLRDHRVVNGMKTYYLKVEEESDHEGGEEPMWDTLSTSDYEYFAIEEHEEGSGISSSGSNIAAASRSSSSNKAAAKGKGKG